MLSACSNDETYLPALLSDPMAKYEAEGLVVSDSWEYGQRSSFLGSAPVQAEVGRTYRIEDQSQAVPLLSDAVALAESEGWTMSKSLTGRPDQYRGTKELAPGSGELSIGLVSADPSNDSDGSRQLVIHLEFDPVPTEESSTGTQDS